MPSEEESRSLLLQFRRLLFSRFRALNDGDLEGALTLNSALEILEIKLHTIDRLPGAGRRLLDQCDYWIDEGDRALAALQRRADGLLFRERADLEIKNFLRKMFPDQR